MRVDCTMPSWRGSASSNPELLDRSQSTRETEPFQETSSANHLDVDMIDHPLQTSGRHDNE